MYVILSAFLFSLLVAYAINNLATGTTEIDTIMKRYEITFKTIILHKNVLGLSTRYQ